MSSIFGSVPILAVVAIQLLLIPCVVSSLNVTNDYLHHACNNTQGKYKPGSVFEKNLNSVLKTISTFKMWNGYAFETNMDRHLKKIPPDTAFVFVKCRGDSYDSKCKSCLAIALAGLRKKCPGNKAGTIWYDQCTLDISTYSAGDTRILYDNYLCMENPKELKEDPEMYKEKERALTTKLLAEATNLANDGKYALYAKGETMVGKKKLYGMVQCSNELDKNGCYVCLDWLIRGHQFCGFQKQGLRFLCRSCNARFEFYPFLRT